MSLLINQSIPPVVAQGVTADIGLQPGSVISARVLQILGGDQVRIAIGGQSLDVVSQVPLQAGQTLQLSVSQTATGISLAVVNPQGGASANQGAAGSVSPPATNAAATLGGATLAPDAAASLVTSSLAASGVPAQAPAASIAANQLTALEAIAVTGAAQSAATQQTGLGPLFANLGVASGLNSLPPQVQQAVAQLLAQRTSLDQNLTADDIKQAFQSSGLFLEASLASGSVSPSGATPDLKAALIVLRQVLTTSLDGVTTTSGSPATSNTPATITASATQISTSGQTSLAAVTAAPGEGVSTPAIATAVQSPASTVLSGLTPVTPGLTENFPSSGQISPQQATIIVELDTPGTIASPALAPTLTPGNTFSAAAAQAQTSQIVPDVLDPGVASGIVASPATPADVAARTAASNAALTLLQEVVQAGPLTAAGAAGLAFGESQMLSLLPALSGVRLSNVDDSGLARGKGPPPPIGGALTAAQPVTAASLLSNATAETAMRHLLNDTDGAIARQTLLQVASLPDRADATGVRIDANGPRWNFEIPFATPRGTAMAQFEIARDAGGNEVEASKRVWRARFSLDVEPAGPVHALVSLNGDRTSVRMWAERPATANQLREGVSQLNQALSRAELVPGDIVIRDGTPAQSATAPAGHFLDRAL